MELVPLDGQAHQTTSFSCGEEPLDRWLRAAAAPRRRDTTRTFVVSDHKRVLAYYSWEAFSIELAALPSHEATRVCIPAIRLAALAVDSREQGRDVGSALLLDALATCVRATGLHRGLRPWRDARLPGGSAPGAGPGVRASPL